jgi:hypothetical protein
MPGLNTSRLKRLMIAGTVMCAGALGGLTTRHFGALAREDDATQLVAHNASGVVRTIDLNGPLDLDNPFFKELGTNGRSCFSCHRPGQGWTITPESVQHRFEESRGLDPIFRTNDWSNCEGADVCTLGKRRAAYSLLLTRGLIRVGIDLPIGAEFVIDSVTAARVPRNEEPVAGARVYATNEYNFSTIHYGEAATDAIMPSA